MRRGHPVFTNVYDSMRMIRTYVLRNFRNTRLQKRAGTQARLKRKREKENVDANKLRGRSGRKGKRERDKGRQSERKGGGEGGRESGAREREIWKLA